MGQKKEVPYDALLPETLRALGQGGALLVTQGREGKPNPMTIGWGSVGLIWGRPVFTILVRPSRFSYTLLEENGDFSVNVMPETMADALRHCGAVSGRDTNKFADTKMTTMPGLQARAPIIAESLVAYECRTVMRNSVLTEKLDVEIRNSAYPKGDFHGMFFGQILCVRAEPGGLAKK